MRSGVGRQRAANPNSPARLSPVFNPQKFPSASGALGTRATKGRSLGKINTSSARRLPALAPGLEGPVSHFVDSAFEEKGSPRPEGAGGPCGGQAARCPLHVALRLGTCWRPPATPPRGPGPHSGPTRPGPPWPTPRSHPWMLPDVHILPLAWPRDPVPGSGPQSAGHGLPTAGRRGPHAGAWAGCPLSGRRDSPASGLGHLFLVVTKPLLNMQDRLGAGCALTRRVTSLKKGPF